MKYDLPIIEWISLGLEKEKLGRTAEHIKKNEKIDDRLRDSRRTNQEYLKKILREEALKQFKDDTVYCHNPRPMVETILNAVDAKPRDMEDYRIDIRFKGRRFRVNDNGTGMTLEDILKNLVIPFSTEKGGYDEIGKYGTGFISTFNYCVESPGRNRVIFDTQRDGVRYAAEFYSTSENVEDMRMRIKRKMRRRKDGTRVSIRRKINSVKDLTKYLDKTLCGIPTYKARISANGKGINDDSEEKWYGVDVEMDINGRNVMQKVGFKKGSPGIHLTSQGVAVKSFAAFNGATISFPSAVHLVEGRDEFKIDENYKKGIDGCFIALENYIREKSEEGGINHAIVEFIPNIMSAFGIRNIADVPNIGNLQKALLPGKKYVLGEECFSEIHHFLGKTLDDLAFAASPQGCAYWMSLYGSRTDLIKEVLAPTASFTPRKFRESFEDLSFYPNLSLLARKVVERMHLGGNNVDFLCSHSRINLVHAPRDSENPFFVSGDSLYINTDHKLIEEPHDKLKVYALLMDYYLALPASEYLEFNRTLDSAKRKVVDSAGQYGELMYSLHDAKKITGEENETKPAQ